MKIDAYLIGRPQTEQSYDINRPNWVRLTKDLCFVINGLEYWIPSEIYDIDGASIPKLVWAIPGIGAKTDPINLAGAFPHDALCLCHCLPFEVANEAARMFWVGAGKSRFAARTMHFFIDSFIGRRVWENNLDEQAELHAVKKMIRERPDWEKFKNLWFPEKTYESAYAI